MSAEALYNSIKSGKTQLTDLNDEGKNALSGYMDSLPSSTRSQESKQYYDEMNKAYQSNPDVFKTPVIKKEAPQANNSGWNGILDNPITRGAETGLSWLQKPFESISAIAADTVGQTRNLLGSQKRIGMDGKEFISKPSQSRDLGKDLQNIWSQTNEHVSSDAWKGTLPNLNKLPGTDVNITDAIDFGAQALPLGEISAPLKAVKALKLAEEARATSKILPDYSSISLSQGKGINNPIKPDVQSLNVGGDISPTAASGKFNYTPDELNVIKSHVENPYIDVNKVEIPKEYQGKDILYRRDSADMNLTDKPHGAYFSYLNDGKSVYTSHFDAGGTDHWFTPNFKNTLDVKPSVVETNARAGTKKLETSAGVQAALDLSENPDILHYSKDNLEILIKDLDPSLNLSKYHDNWELLEVYGAQLAKEHGYDSIALRVHDDPASSEVVALKNDAFKPINKQGKSLNADVKNPEPIKLTPKEQAQQARIDQFSKIENNPVIPNTMDQIQSKTGRESTPFSTKANQAYINTVDNLHRTNQFDQVAKDANGGILNPSDSAYTLGLNARGHDMQASQIVNKNMINAQGEVTGQSLADVTHQIPKDQEQAFKDYVVAKNSITRMGRGEHVYSEEKNMTIQKAKEIVNQYDATNPEFKNIQQQYTKFHQDFAQQWYVDTGLFKQEQINKAFEDNPNYVPNKRVFSDLEKKTAYGNSKAGSVGQSNPVKRYGEAGSKRPIVDPIESSVEDIAKGVKTARNNEAGQAIVRSLQRNPDELKGFAEIEHDHPKLNVDEMLQKDGMQGVIDHINQTFEDATRKHDAEKGNVVTVLVHGEPVHVRVFDPQFLESISNLSPKGQDYVTNAVGKVTKTMKTLTTGINPVFGLTRNISRDIPHAFVSSKTTNNPIKFGADLVDGLTSVLADSMSHSKMVPDFMKGWLEARGNLYNDYKNMGGGHSSAIAADRNLLAQSKEKILPSKGIGQTLKRNLLTRPYHLLENVNNAAEAAPRLGEYKRTIQQGLDQGKGLYDSKVKALYEANDLTTNFNKFGNVTKNVDAYLPYLNAAVQGLDQITRMGTQGGAKRLTAVYGKAIGALTIPTAVLYMINHNDPNYQQTSNFIKDNYLLIPNGDGTFKKIAKPRELGMVFSTGVERALRAFADHDPRAFQDFGTAFLKNFLPPGAGGAVDGYNQKGLAGVPGGFLQDTIAGPMVDLERNKNFANQPIVPQDLLGLSPRNQYDAKTSEPAKFLGNLLNSSPKQLDFLAKSYLGVIGQLGIPATTKGGSIGDTLKQQINVDPTFSNDISKNFYDQKAKADMAKADAKFTGVPQQQDMSAYYDKLATQFGKLRSQMKMVQKDDTISNTDKRAKLKELQDNLNKIQKDATR